jgi:replicative DNA helicase
MTDKFDAFGQSFQIKLLSALLKNAGFLEQIHDILKPEYFQNESFIWLIKQILDYFVEYKRKPTIDVLKIRLEDVTDALLKEEIKSYIMRIFKHLQSDDLEAIQVEAIRFCRHQNMKNTIFDSIDLIKVEDYDGIFRNVKKALEAGQESDIGYEYKGDIESRYKDSERKTIPTPWNSINELIAGGFGRGELVVFVGGSGAGKSWVLANVGLSAVKSGLNVIHYTMELDQYYTAIRYDSILTKIPMEKLRADFSKVERMIETLPGNLTIKYYPTKSASVLTLRSHIEKTIMRGERPDIIVVDYADLLKHGKYEDKRHQLEAIYQELRGLGGEYGIPIITASQSNRQGYQETVIQGQHISEAFEKIMISDFVASISRNDNDKLHGKGRFHIIKNRMGADGITLPADMDLSIGDIKIHPPGDPALSRQLKNSNQSESDTIRELLGKRYDKIEKSNTNFG